MKIFAVVLVVALLGSVSSQGMRGLFNRANIPPGVGDALGGQLENYAGDQLGKLGNAGGNLGGDLGSRFGGEMGRNLGQSLGNNMGNKLANQAGNKMGLEPNKPADESSGCPVKGLIEAMRKDLEVMQDVASRLSSGAAAAVNGLMKLVGGLIESLTNLPNDPTGSLGSITSQISSFAQIIVENGAQFARESVGFGILMPNTLKYLFSLGTRILTNPMGFMMSMISPSGYLSMATNLITGSGPMSMAVRMGLSMTPLGPLIPALTMANTVRNAGSGGFGGMAGLAGNALTGGLAGGAGSGLAGLAGNLMGGSAGAGAIGGGAGAGAGNGFGFSFLG